MWHLHQHKWTTLDSQVITVEGSYLKRFWQTDFVTELLQCCHQCGKFRIHLVADAWEDVPGTMHRHIDTPPDLA